MPLTYNDGVVHCPKCRGFVFEEKHFVVLLPDPPELRKEVADSVAAPITEEKWAYYCINEDCGYRLERGNKDGERKRISLEDV